MLLSIRHALGIVENAMVRAFHAFIILGVAIATIIVSVQVFFRYVLNNALGWPQHTAILLMVWIALLGGAYAYSKGEMIQMTYLEYIIPPTAVDAIEVIVNLGVIFIASRFIIDGAAMAASQAGFDHRVLGISLMWFRLPLVVGGVLFILASVTNLLDIALGDREEANADATADGVGE